MWAGHRGEVRAAACVIGALAQVACSGDGRLGGEPDDEATSSIASGSTTSGSSSTSGGTVTESADGVTGDGSPGSMFLGPYDHGSSPFPCDLFTQNCPVGEKCMAWADDGGSSWNATRCSPIADDPAAKGEPCHAEGSPTSGIDDCELGAMCWVEDPKTNEGVCVDYCVGSSQEPFCEDPDEQCPIGGDGAIVICRPVCNPLQTNACPEGQACYPILQEWMCAPDASGDLGAYGDPCDFINRCDSGLACLDSSTVPPGQPCEGASGCCTEVCDLDDPLGDLQCAGAAEGQICRAWYDEDTVAPGYEDVGACALPP